MNRLLPSKGLVKELYKRSGGHNRQLDGRARALSSFFGQTTTIGRKDAGTAMIYELVLTARTLLWNDSRRSRQLETRSKQCA